MKRTLLALTTALMTVQCSNAQITLNNSSYTTTFAGTVDTFLSSGTGVTYPALIPATNATWDMTTAVLATPVAHAYNVAAYTASYPSATFADKHSFQYPGAFPREGFVRSRECILIWLNLS